MKVSCSQKMSLRGETSPDIGSRNFHSKKEVMARTKTRLRRNLFPKSLTAKVRAVSSRIDLLREAPQAQKPSRDP